MVSAYADELDVRVLLALADHPQSRRRLQAALFPDARGDFQRARAIGASLQRLRDRKLAERDYSPDPGVQRYDNPPGQSLAGWECWRATDAGLAALALETELSA